MDLGRGATALVTGLPALGSAERQLLLTCGHVQLDGRQEARARDLIDEGLDWDAVVAHARLHSVAPLLYWNLRSLGALQSCPSPARDRLLAAFHRAAYQNKHFAMENGALVEAFDRAGVTALVPKGLVLCEEVYGGLDRRPLIDLVFLVPAGEIDASERTLAGRGYGRHALRTVEAVYRWACPQAVFSRSTAIKIEVILFSNLVNWPRLHRLELGGLIARARRTFVDGTQTLTLSPVDLVLYLCMQADNHGHFNRVAVGREESQELLFAEWSNNRLVRFVDIHETIRHHRQGIDWDLLVELARSSGLEGPVWSSLSLAEQLLGPTAPPDVLARLAPAHRHRLRRLVYAGLTNGASGGDGPSPPAAVAARAWSRAGGARQIQLARLIGLAEFALPGSQLFRLYYGERSGRARALLRALHLGRTLVRTAASYLRAVAVARGPLRQVKAGRP